MEFIKTIVYILAGILLCTAWFTTFALGYIMQGTWVGAACFAINAAINIALASQIGIRDGKKGKKGIMQNDYKFNQRFYEYVDKYCKKHGYTVDEALTHELVKQVYRYYTEESD